MKLYLWSWMKRVVKGQAEPTEFDLTAAQELRAAQAQYLWACRYLRKKARQNALRVIDLEARLAALKANTEIDCDHSGYPDYDAGVGLCNDCKTLKATLDINDKNWRPQ